jgi:hypothetical protein
MSPIVTHFNENQWNWLSFMVSNIVFTNGVLHTSIGYWKSPITFLIIFNEPLRSAFINFPLFVLNKPLFTLLPLYYIIKWNIHHNNHMIMIENPWTESNRYPRHLLSAVCPLQHMDNLRHEVNYSSRLFSWKIVGEIEVPTISHTR